MIPILTPTSCTQTNHATTLARFGFGGLLEPVALVVCAGLVCGGAEALGESFVPSAFIWSFRGRGGLPRDGKAR